MNKQLNLKYSSHFPAKGLSLLEITDDKSGFSLISSHGNPKVRSAAYKGWLAARHSRAPGDTKAIAIEMGEKGVDPDAKLDVTYKGYGHGSVADGARLDVHFNNVPMIVPFALFHRGYINSGQEKSTRYQVEFTDKPLHEIKNYVPIDLDSKDLELLSNEYQSIGFAQLKNFQGFLADIQEKYEDFYGPVPKKAKNAFTSRSLDTARFMLLLGQNTGFAYETSARDWERHISYMKGHDMEIFRRTGFLLNNLLAPDTFIEEDLGIKAEAPTLLKYTKPNTTTKNLIKELTTNDRQTRFKSVKLNEQKTALSNSDMALAAITQLYLANVPNLNSRNKIMNWIDNLSLNKKKALSQHIFSNYTHHDELPGIFRTTGLVATLDTQLGEIRDWNRHKSVGRFIQGLPTIYQLGLTRTTAKETVNNGFGVPSYLNIPEFEELKVNYLDLMNRHYDNIVDFQDTLEKVVGKESDYSVIQNLLPLGHSARISMHMTPQDVNYITKLRTRPGGHINYREQAHKLGQLIENINPLLSGLKLKDEKPDPSSKQQFYDRG